MPSLSSSNGEIDSTSKQEGWTDFSASYQQRVGACTLHGTARLVDIVNDILPFDKGSHVLDSGTGGGSIVIKIKEKFPATEILATDISIGMLEQVDSLHLPGVSTKLEDAVDLAGLSDNTFTHALTSFMIQFTPDPQATLHAMYRVLKPGRIAGVAIWGPENDAETIHNSACARLNPEYEPPIPLASSMRSEESLKAAMTKAGFRDIKTLSIRMPFDCRDTEHFNQYWFESGNPVPVKLMKHWTENGGNLKALRKEATDISKEQFDDGKSIFFGCVLGWGNK